MKGRRIHVIYYEDLKSPEKLKPILNQVSDFMNFTMDMERLNCVLKHPKGQFLRKETCFDRKTRPSNNKSDFIYTNQQIVWMNSAIRKVNEEIGKRGLETSHLLSYEDSNLKITYCHT